MHDDALKKKDEEKRRHERRQRHLQDDLRYALKKVSEVTANSTYEEVGFSPSQSVFRLTNVKAVPAMEHLSEYKALDDEGRRSAFSKFVKRQKERLREASEDGGSASGRRRKEPARDDRDRSRERERDTRDRRDSHRDHADSSHRERDRRGSDRRGSERRESRGDWERDAPPAPRRSDSKRDLPPHEKMDERADKVRTAYPRYLTFTDAELQRPKFEREDTPEEGEI
jgi:pre-mRNA-processing factor 40